MKFKNRINILLVVIGILVVFFLPNCIRYNMNEKGIQNFSSPTYRIQDIPVGWIYESILTINPVTPVADYQVKVILNPYNFNYAKANSDGSDLRFYDSLDNKLSYWLETWNAGGESILWAKVPAAGTSTLHLYYGNPAAVSESNGDATFLFFDDFSGSSINTSKWNSEGDAYSTVSVAGGIVTLTSTSATQYNSHGVSIGFSDYVINHGVVYGTTSTKSLVFNNDCCASYNKTISTLYGYDTRTVNAVPYESWFLGEIRWLDSHLVEFHNGTTSMIKDQSIPSGPLTAQLTARMADFPNGYHFGAMATSVVPWGQSDRACRFFSWNRYPSDDYNQLKCDWFLIRTCSPVEPVVTVDDIFKSIIILDRATPEADYQVKVQLDPSTFDYSKTYPGGRDIRFVDDNYNSMNYWIQSWNSSGTSTIWVKIPTTGTSIFNMYYGDSNAISESNGETTFLFFDDFLGISLNPIKWWNRTDTYSTLTVAGSTVTVYTDTPNTFNAGSSLGFSDFEVDWPRQTFGENMTNGLSFGILSRGDKVYTKSTSLGILENYVVPQRTWFNGEIRWLSDSLVQYDNESTVLTHTNSTAIPDGSYEVRILTHAGRAGDGDGWGAEMRSIGTFGQIGRALHSRSYHDYQYDGTDKTSIAVDWVFVRKCNIQEPKAFIDPIPTISSPESTTYFASMDGYFTSPYAMSKNTESWLFNIPDGSGFIKLEAELDGHKNVVQMRKAGGGTRAALFKYFTSNVTKGIVEFWFYKDTAANLDATKFALTGYNQTGHIAILEFGVEDGDLYANRWADRVIVGDNVVTPNTWHHVQIDFDISQGGYQVVFDGVLYGSGYAYTFYNTPTHFSYFSTGTHWSACHPNYGSWFDAFGFNFECGYEVGANLNEGLLLKYSFPTILYTVYKYPINWMGYAVNNDPILTAHGNAVIPMTDNGNHDIQVFCSDIKGNWYSSSSVPFQSVISVPTITGPNDFAMNFGETGYSILWSVSDPYPANYTVYQNETAIKTGNWTDSVIISLDGLEEGIYNFTLICSNLGGAIATDEVWVTVLPGAPDITPPIISSPDDITFEEGSIGYSITWEAFDDRAPWWAIVTRDSTLIYSQMWIGNDIQISLDGLSEGTYLFNCTIEDEAGNKAFDIVFVTILPFVPDIDAPNVISPGSLIYEVGSEGNALNWSCFDAHPYAYQISKDGDIQKYAPWHGENISFNVDGLPIGTYLYNLTLWDLSGNSVFDTVLVVVIPPVPDTTPPTISQPADLVFTENMRGTITWEVFDEHPRVCVIYRNGTVVYSQGYWSSGIIQYSFVSLSLGTWEFTLTVWDEAGNSASSDALVKILPGSIYDFTPPEISHHADLDIIYGSTGNTLVFYLFDQHPEGYQIFIGTVLLSEHLWSTPNIGVNVSVDGLAIGSYTIKIFAWDIYDNNATMLVGVTVSGDLTPPEITPLADLNVQEGAVEVTWVASDAAPASYQIVDLTDGSILDDGSWDGDDIVYEWDSLEVGEYYLRCIVYDVSGNFAMDDVKITVVKAQSAPGFDYITLGMTILVLIVFRAFFASKRRFKR
ncbi:MAG: DUF2341 domain-containing protein [Promethearchaeota archaeon]